MMLHALDVLCSLGKFSGNCPSMAALVRDLHVEIKRLQTEGSLP